MLETVYTKDFNEKRYGGLTVEWDPLLHNIVVSMVGNSKKVLDLGCGDGSLGKKLLMNDNTVWGIDASPTLVREAIAVGIKAQVRDLEGDSEYSNDTFDVVTATEVIEHLWDTDKFLQKAHNCLKEGGELVISTPNLASLGRRLLLLLGRNPRIESSPALPSVGHMKYFVKGSLFELLQVNGFKVVELKSNTVNFDTVNARPFGKFLAKIVPSLGSVLIVKAIKVKK